MKKITFLMAVLGIFFLSSCDTKSCRCYELRNSRWTGPYTTTAEYGISCSSLNNPTTYCNEMDDPIIDPDDIAIGKKRK